MKTNYVFGDRVKVLPKSDEAMIYSNAIEYTKPYIIYLGD